MAAGWWTTQNRQGTTDLLVYFLLFCPPLCRARQFIIASASSKASIRVHLYTTIARERSKLFTSLKSTVTTVGLLTPFASLKCTCFWQCWHHAFDFHLFVCFILFFLWCGDFCSSSDGSFLVFCGDNFDKPEHRHAYQSTTPLSGSTIMAFRTVTVAAVSFYHYLRWTNASDTEPEHFTSGGTMRRLPVAALGSGFTFRLPLTSIYWQSS